MDEDTSNWSMEKLRRKRDQAWEIAGCARQDNDRKEEVRYTELATFYARKIGERVRGEA